MRIALLGCDEDALELVRWAIEGGHEVLVVYGVVRAANDLQKLQPEIRFSDNWEELLLGSTADAVIVARGSLESALLSGSDPRESTADQLRKLAQAAIPMIVVCPACESIVGFEIEMIRHDVGGVIVPYVPDAMHESIDELATYLAARDQLQIGTVEQISFEREQKNRDREAVLLQLARDVTLLRQAIGTIQTVTASGPPTEVGRDPLGPKSKQLPSLANLTVTFSGATGRTARWSIGPPMEGDQGRLNVICQRMKASITMPAKGDWVVRYSGEKTSTATISTLGHAVVPLAQLAWAKAGHARYDASAWLAACRDQEAAEAVDRSLARGRTIELFNEEHTEEASFKGIMAMGGCLILVGALALVLLAAVVEGLHLPMRNWPLWRLWPVYLITPIMIFLLLQLLNLAVKRNEASPRPTLPVS